MAPRTRMNDKKQRRSHRKEVHFPRREVPVRKSATAIHPPANYENLILYYLAKLKRLFSTPDHPHPKGRENSADRMRREHLEEKRSKSSKLEINSNKYTASHSAPRPREDGNNRTENEIKEKVYNIVNAAIEYGFANNVLEKRGDCFVFKNKKNFKLANRQPTPGPSAVKRSYCSQCSCNNCKTVNVSSENNYRQCRARPKSEMNTSRTEHSKSGANVHESKTQHPLGLSGKPTNNGLHSKKSSRSKSCTVTPNNFNYRVRKLCTCSRCRALEQRRKMQRK